MSASVARGSLVRTIRGCSRCLVSVQARGFWDPPRNASSSHDSLPTQARRKAAVAATQRQYCDKAEQTFAEQVVYALRLHADQRKLKEGALDSLLDVVREAAVQAESNDPDMNDDLHEKMEKLGGAMLYIGGSFLLMAAKDVGSKCIGLAVPFLRKGALLGHLGAKYSFARVTLDGTGVERDPAEAVRLFEEIAATAPDEKDPYPQAVFTLGVLYFYGRGVSVDTPRALELFNKAADAGLTQSLHTLGLLYLQGDGVVVDHAKAMDYFRRGQAKDDARCINELATCTMMGTGGVEKDATKACELYHDAAQLGNTNAMHSLGVCYWEGRGVMLSEEKAAYWWTQAADLDHPRASVNLARMYVTGTVVKRDIKLARSLLQAALKSGLPQAADVMDELEEALKADPSLDDSTDTK